jgi:hypothetical protein
MQHGPLTAQVIFMEYKKIPDYIHGVSISAKRREMHDVHIDVLCYKIKRSNILVL